MMRLVRFVLAACFLIAVLAVAGVFGASAYYSSERGRGCASCHEMAAVVASVHGSQHRTVGCMQCHRASLATKLRHIRVHLFGPKPEAIRLPNADVMEMTTDCQSCHRKEYSDWHAGPHSATYSEIFTDASQNKKQRLMDDCLRCHGMYFEGGIRDLVQPQDAKGPWHLVHSELTDKPAIPCMACHQVHRGGDVAANPNSRISVEGPRNDESLAFYDRREQMHIVATALPLPVLFDQARHVNVSPDPRQGVCYQCHAPRPPDTGTEAAAKGWGWQVGSGDDRTPMGVHEGISCLACHNSHNENGRASCKNCHAPMSHGGIDLEKMDTTFASAASPHNIHWVKCTDCHQHGIPAMKAQRPSA
jgi:hypothetical protein